MARRKGKRRKRATAAQLRALRKGRAVQAAKRARRRRGAKKAARTRRTKAASRRRRRSKPVTRRRAVARKRGKRRGGRRRQRRSGNITLRRVRGKVYRSNPRFSVQGVMRAFQQGAIDAAGVVGGKAATRVIANFLPIPKETAVANFAAQGISAIIAGMVAQQFLPRDVARMIVAGGMAAPVETILKGVPVIGPFLGDDYLQLGEYYMGEGLLAPGQEQYVGEYDDIPLGEYAEVY